MTLDLEELEDLPTNKIPGFYERIQSLIPSLYNHQCSEGKPGGFFDRVKDGTWMGHVIEHIALELQTLAKMEVGFGRTRGTGKVGEYHVVFSYTIEEAGLYTAKAAIRIAEALIQAQPYNLEADIKHLKHIWEEKNLGPSTYSIVNEAAKRGIPYYRLNEGSLVQLGYGAKQKRIEATIVGTTSNIAVELAGDKQETKNLLTQAFIPVPAGLVIEDVERLAETIDQVGFPIVIKPFNGNHGKGATINIKDLKTATEAFLQAKTHSQKIIIEKYITGKDFRVLVIDYKLAAAARRTPAAVTGDGVHSIQQLIDKANKDPRRGNGHCNLLTKIIVDDNTHRLLAAKDYTLETILPQGEEVYLKSTANLSTGGTSEDVTDKVHPSNISLFERIARIVGLDICGIDIIATDLENPLTETGGTVLEVNAAPGFRMHLKPTKGMPRNVAAPVVDMLFPNSENGRIPIVAITGTNGKTTTTRLVANMAQQQGYHTGFTTTDGIYINKELIYKGDCSGPNSAQALLKDSAVEFAVLETARGGILRSGLGYDACHCAIITNIAEDHLGLNGIDTLEKLARVKSVVAEAVLPGGYAVLNADDDLVYDMRNNLKCNIALFSLYADNIRIKKHCEAGGIAAVYDEGYIIIRKGNTIIPIEEVQNVPLTYGGKAKFNIANALAATMAAYLSNISLSAICSTLRNFEISPENTPGRINIIDFGNFTLMMDYAHNPHGLRALGEFIKTLEVTKRTGVITGVGDRRNEDIIALGEEAAKIFDEIIIRHDEDLRGRTAAEIYSLLRNGINKVDPQKPIHDSLNELQSIEYAVDTATPGSLVVVLIDQVQRVYKKVQELQIGKVKVNQSA